MIKKVVISALVAILMFGLISNCAMATHGMNIDMNVIESLENQIDYICSAIEMSEEETKEIKDRWTAVNPTPTDRISYMGRHTQSIFDYNQTEAYKKDMSSKEERFFEYSFLIPDVNVYGHKMSSISGTAIGTERDENGNFTPEKSLMTGIRIRIEADQGETTLELLEKVYKRLSESYGEAMVTHDLRYNKMYFWLFSNEYVTIEEVAGYDCIYYSYGRMDTEKLREKYA